MENINNEDLSKPSPSKEHNSITEYIKPSYITANPVNYKFIKKFRDVLKGNPTEAEKIIWEFLRNKKTGHKIRRQHYRQFRCRLCMLDQKEGNRN